MAITRTGYIGLGNIGKSIAANVVKGGFDLMVYDLREEPLRELEALGAKVARSPREVGEYAELIELSVVNDAQVEQAVLGPNGVMESARPGTLIAVHSTIHPRTVKKLAEVGKDKGVGILDAAVSGGQMGAKAQTLCYMVGGEKEHFDLCKPVFETSGSNIFHVGPLGMGATAKLGQQVIVCLHRLAAFEGMTLAEKAGLDPKILQQVVHVTNAQSRIADNWDQFRGMADPESEEAKTLAHGFWSGLIPALQLGHEVGFAMPATALVQQQFPRVLGLEKV